MNKQNQLQEVLRIAAKLWKRRFGILCGTVAFTAGVCFYIYFMSPPVYVAKTILFPKEQTSSLGEALSLGGGFQSALQNRIIILLESEDLAQKVVERENLLPALFPKLWDEGTGTWNVEDRDPPTFREGAKRLAKTIKVSSARGYVEVSIETDTDSLSPRYLQGYLNALNEHMLDDAKRGAEENIHFLQEQLNSTVDPILRERIQSLIATQISSIVYQSAQSFYVIGEPRPPLEADRPPLVVVVVVSLLLGCMLSSAIALMVAMAPVLKVRWQEVQREH